MNPLRNGSTGGLTAAGCIAVLVVCLFPKAGLAIMESAPFYRLGVGARALGMGGAFVSVADDPTTIYWNPSGLPDVEDMAVSAMHLTPYQMESSHDFVTTVFPLSDLSTWGMYYLRASTPDIPITQLGIDGLPDIAGHTKDDRNLLGFSYGRKFGQSFSAGCTIKYISEKLGDAKSSALGADVGFLFQASPVLRLGFAIQDVTETLISWNTGHADTVPQRYTFGLSGKLLDEKLTLALDADMIKNSPSEWHLGGEYVFADMLAVRAGMNARRLTAGLGFKFGRWEMNYSFENHDLGDHHRVGMTVWWGSDDLDKTGSSKVESILGQYHESLDQLLEIEPEEDKAVWENRRDWVPPYSTESTLTELAPLEPPTAATLDKSIPPAPEPPEPKPAVEPAPEVAEAEEDDFISLLESIAEPEAVEPAEAAPEEDTATENEAPVRSEPEKTAAEAAETESFLSMIEADKAARETIDTIENNRQPETTIKRLPAHEPETTASAAFENISSLPPQPFKESRPRIIYPASVTEADEASLKKAQEDLVYLANCVKSYNYLAESNARSLRDLEGKTFDEVPVDPWNTPYRLDRKKGAVLSAGKDREPGSLDDLSRSYLH